MRSFFNSSPFKQQPSEFNQSSESHNQMNEDDPGNTVLHKVDSELETKASVKLRRKSSSSLLLGFGGESLLSSDYNSSVPSDVQTFMRRSNIAHRRSLRTPDSKTVVLDEAIENLTEHIIDSVEALRNVVRQTQTSSDGKSSQQAAKRHLLQTMLSSVSKYAFTTATKGWGDMKGVDSGVDDYLKSTEQILQRFPEVLLKKNKATGKCLIHLICARAHESFGDRIIGAAIKSCPESFKLYDLDGSTALHILVSRRCVSPSVISDIIKICPDAVKRKDIHGNYPLNILLKQTAPHPDVVEKLLAAFPKSAHEKDSKGNIPMHAVLKNSGVGVNAIKSLYKAHPDGIRLLTSEGLLPIHQLVSQPDPNVEILKFLVSKYPKSLEAQSAEAAQTALHIAVDSDSPSIEAASFLLYSYPKAAQVADHNGYLPLHTALDHPSPPLGLIEMLLKQHPDAAKCPTKDGLLPLHIAIGMSDQPSPALIQRLADAHPSAVLQLAVEYVTGEDDADPFAYDGHWVKRSWTPLARAVERKHEAVVKVMRTVLHQHGLNVDDVLEPLESAYSLEKPSAEMLSSRSRARSVRSLRSWRSLRDVEEEEEEESERQSQGGSDSGGSSGNAPPVVRRLKSQRSLVPLPREQSPYRHPPRLSYTEAKPPASEGRAGTDMESRSGSIGRDSSPSALGSPDRGSVASQNTPSASPTRYSQLSKSLSIQPTSPSEEKAFELPNSVQLSTIRKSPLYSQGVLSAKRNFSTESSGVPSYRSSKRSPRASPRVKVPEPRNTSLRVSASDSILPTASASVAEPTSRGVSPLKKFGVAWSSDTRLDTTGEATEDSARSNVSVGVIYKENNDTNLLHLSSDQHQKVRARTGDSIVGFGYSDKANEVPSAATELDDESFRSHRNMPTVTIKSPRGSRPSSQRIVLNDGELI